MENNQITRLQAECEVLYEKHLKKLVTPEKLPLVRFFADLTIVTDLTFKKDFKQRAADLTLPAGVILLRKNIPTGSNEKHALDQIHDKLLKMVDLHFKLLTQKQTSKPKTSGIFSRIFGLGNSR